MGARFPLTVHRENTMRTASVIPVAIAVILATVPFVGRLVALARRMTAPFVASRKYRTYETVTEEVSARAWCVRMGTSKSHWIVTNGARMITLAFSARAH